MSTRALIGTTQPDGSVRAIYLHHDGYPEHAGTILETHYSSDEDAAALVALGGCSSLAATLEESEFYHRDRGERRLRTDCFDGPAEFKREAGNFDHVYLWDGEVWIHAS
jgi:hypothetical protein